MSARGPSDKRAGAKKADRRVAPQTKSDRTRAQIIEGALRVINQVGLYNSTTRMIAKESGVQLATLHYHFDNKGALLVAVLEALIEEMTTTMRRWARKDSSLDEAIETLLQGARRTVLRSIDKQIVHFELTLYALREGLEWLAEKQYDAYVQSYVVYLSESRGATEALSPIATVSLARFMLAGVDGLILQELTQPHAARLKRGVDALAAASQAYARSLRA